MFFCFIDETIAEEENIAVRETIFVPALQQSISIPVSGEVPILVSRQIPILASGQVPIPVSGEVNIPILLGLQFPSSPFSTFAESLVW